MPTKPPNARGDQVALRRKQNRDLDRQRGSAADRGYDAVWARESKAHLRANPFCRYCELQGRTTAAALVDHLYPHRGDKVLFWIREWWVSCCRACHNGFKQRLEALGQAALDQLADLLNLPRRGPGTTPT